MRPKGFRHSAEARAKMSVAKMGRPVSQETRARISAWQLGRKLSPEHCANMSAANRGERNPNWKGGRKRTGDGYILVWSPNHPHHNCLGYVLEHRLVMEAFLGRQLLPTEVVHHINEIRDDNRIENLMRFDSKGEHRRHHHRR